jgi:hypothetical protein
VNQHEKVLDRLERLRRWGMICDCPEHLDARREHPDRHLVIDCFMNSRRIKDAWKTVKCEIDRANLLHRTIVPAQVENHPFMFRYIKTSLLKVQTELHKRFHYLDLPPWCFCRADEREGAAHFMAEFRARPEEDHDVMTCWLADNYGEDMDACALGGESSDRLKQEVQTMCMCPLNEAAGEGYHRSTHHEVTRATASSTVHVKQAVRKKAAIHRVRDSLPCQRRAGPGGRPA